MTALLEVEDLRVAYGKIEAVKGISFKVDAGEVVTLIGTNGAGKTTTLRTLSGLLKPVGGQVKFNGKSLKKIPAHDIVASVSRVRLPDVGQRIGVGQHLESLLEGREVVRAHDDRGRTSVARHRHTLVLALYAVDHLAEAIADVAQRLGSHGHNCGALMVVAQGIRGCCPTAKLTTLDRCRHVATSPQRTNGLAAEPSPVTMTRCPHRG